jgi:hypothetical protein
MEYVIAGRLTGRISPEYADDLSGATVKLYRVEADGEHGPPHVILSHEEVRAEEYRLVAQADADGTGAYSINIGRDRPRGNRGSLHAYAGEPLEMHLLFLRVGSGSDWAPKGAVQIRVGVVRPEWREEGGELRATHSVELPEEAWARVRSELDEWVVAGRVTQSAGTPLAGVTVQAFDADVVQHDFLGSSVTDERGRFRIDFKGEAFRKTVGGVAKYEMGGPDLFFKVVGPDGTMLLEEDRNHAGRDGRRDVAGCLHADLIVG